MNYIFKISGTLSLALILSNASFSQVTGSRSNGDVSVKEVKAADLTNPAVGSDVNLFSGTFNASQDLGTVSTPSGLSFNLKMNYSSVYSIGNNVAPATGIPYGEGWSLSIPTISVSSESYFKYLTCDANNNKTYTVPEASIEGQNMWFAPFISIPGVISERFILKYKKSPESNWYVFVSNRFDTYVEAWFDGTWIWQVYLPDGTMYEFGTVQFQSKNGSNQRVDNSSYSNVHPIVNGQPQISQYQTVMANLVQPKEEPIVWYCNKIMHPMKAAYGQMIKLEYEKFGEFSFYNEFFQPGIGTALNYMITAYGNINTVYYKDVFLKSVVSLSHAGEIERIQLKYKTIDVNETDAPNMLLLNHTTPNGVYRKDSLYNYKVVYHDGLNTIFSFNDRVLLGLPADPSLGNGGFSSNWTRYPHIKSQANQDGFNFTSTFNPYIGNTPINNTNRYFPLGISAQNDIPFTHSFLESPRINTTAEHDFLNSWEFPAMPAGDIYEIKTLLHYSDMNGFQEGDGNCNFDINIVSGSYDGETNNFCNPAKSFSVFSTFNQALKWNTLVGRYNPDGVGMLTTSNFFVMPNLPREFNGFKIQVGPANSDNKFSAEPDDPSIGMNAPFWSTTFHSSFKTYTNEYPGGDDSQNPLGGLDPTADIPKNFGIGLPWHMMAPLYCHYDIYQPLTENHPITYCDTDGPIFNFWWNKQNPSLNMSWTNVPTRATQDYSLRAVAIVRYSKNPYMLSEVVHYKTNGEVPSVTNSGLIITQKYAFDYTREADYILNNRYCDMFNPPCSALANDIYGVRQVFLLSTIKEIPVNPSQAGTPAPVYNAATIPTTKFEYTMLQNEWLTEGAHANSNVFALTTVTDRLGSIKKIEYYPMYHSDPQQVQTRYLGGDISPLNCLPTQPSSCTPPTYNIARTGAMKVQLIVKTVSLYSEDDPSITSLQPYVKRWDYAYFDPTDKYNGLNFGSLLSISSPNFILAHFKQSSRSQDAGFERTEVTEPAIDNQNPRVKTKYYHYGITTPSNITSLPGLLFGKMYKVESIDERGLLIKKKEIEYKVNLAYANVIFGSQTVLDLDLYFQEYVCCYNPNQSNSYYDMATIRHAYQVNNHMPFLETKHGDAFFESSTNNLSYYLNSYFVRVVKETDREYEYYPSSNFTAVKYNLASKSLAVGNRFTASTKSLIATLPPPDLPVPLCIDYSNYQVISLSTVTTYQYWDANDPNGNSTSEGFQNLIPGFNGQLWHEPSWLLFSKTVTSPELPGTKKRDEYYYYYDLINYYGQEYFGQEAFGGGNNVDKFGVLYWSYEQRMRSIMYEQRSISETPQTTPVAYSKYFWYDNFGHCLPDETPQHSIVTFNTPNEPPPPPPPPSGDYDFTPVSDYQAVAALTTSEVPAGQRIENIDCTNKFKLAYRYTAVQVNDVPVLSRGDYGFGNYTATSPAYPYEPGDAYPIMRFGLGSIMYNDYSHITTNNIDYSYISTSNVHVWEVPVYTEVMVPVFPFDTVVTDSVRLRNVYGQVKLSRDEKGICTKYVYQNLATIFYDDLSTANQNYTSVVAINVGVPVQKIYGWNPNPYNLNYYPVHDVLVTNYEYYPDYSLKKSVNPNGYFETYHYDDYGRLSQVTDDGGIFLKWINYHTWENNNSQDFHQRAAENYIETFTFNHSVANKSLHTRQYIDPLGRSYNTLTQVCPSSGTQAVDMTYMVYSGLNEYDNWGRPVSKLKNFTVTNGGGFVPRDPSLSNNPGIEHNDFQYGYNQRSRVLKASKYGENITTGHTIVTNYDLISGGALSSELGLSASERQLLMPAGLQYFKFWKTAVMDEDNKKSIEYYNAFNQKVAVKQYLGLQPVRTLFVYDGRDLPVKTINPKLQQTTYAYNLLGWLYEKNTPDAGRSRYLFDRSGNVWMDQDANGVSGADNNGTPYLRWYEYDHFGRLIRQSIYNLPYATPPDDDVESDPDYAYYNPLSFDESVEVQDPHWPGDMGTYYEPPDFITPLKTFKMTNGASLYWIPQHASAWGDGMWGSNFTLDPVLPPYLVNHGVNNLPPAYLNHIEKEWIYYNPWADYTTLYDANAFDVSLGYQNYGFNDAANGKVCWSIVYNKLSGTASKPIQYCFYNYNANGTIQSQAYQYNVVDPAGCGDAQSNTQTASIGYSYNRAKTITGKFVTGDGLPLPGVSITYGCDPWNRYTAAYYSPICEIGLGGTAKLCSLEYDDASGLLQNIKHIVYDPVLNTGPQDVTVNQINYTYDVRDRLTRMQDHFLDYNLYYDANQPSAVSPHNVTSDLNYNGNINAISAEYDLVTNVASGGYTDDFQGATHYGYHYDGLNRLTYANASVMDALTVPIVGPEHSYGDAHYTYDKIGNILSSSVGHYYAPLLVPSPPNQVDVWTYNYGSTNNRLNSIDDVTLLQNYPFNYDDNGNFKDHSMKGIASVNYSMTNQPSSINKSPHTLSYLYDVEDIRISKEDRDGTNPTAVNYYLIDAEGKTLGINKGDLNGSGIWQPQWTMYAHVGNNRIGEISGTCDLKFYVNDHLGNTRIKYDTRFPTPSTSIAFDYWLEGVYDYYPFGKVLRSYNPNSEKFLFTGKERDQETELDYFGARFYDSDIGRFLSVDPWEDKYFSWSSYNYTLDRPVSLIDPDGRGVFDFLKSKERRQAEAFAARFEFSQITKIKSHTFEVLYRTQTTAEVDPLFGGGGPKIQWTTINYNVETFYKGRSDALQALQSVGVSSYDQMKTTKSGLDLLAVQGRSFDLDLQQPPPKIVYAFIKLNPVVSVPMSLQALYTQKDEYGKSLSFTGNVTTVLDLVAPFNPGKNLLNTNAGEALDKVNDAYQFIDDTGVLDNE